MAEIADNELEQLKRGYALLAQLTSKPQSKREFENLVKKHINKDVVTTDDLAEPYVAELKQELKTLQDWKAGIEKGQQEWDAGEQVKALKARSFTDEGIEKIKAFQKERGIPNLVDAADLWEQRQPAKPVAPTAFTPQGWNFTETENDDDKLLLSDPDAWADKAAPRIWAEEKAKAARE